MAATPEGQEIRLSKIGSSNGFWRLLVEPAQKRHFFKCHASPDGGPNQHYPA